MKIAQITEGAAGAYTYELPYAIEMAKMWLNRFGKSGELWDFHAFIMWMHRFTDDPALKPAKPQYGMKTVRDVFKIINGYLDLMLKDYNRQNRGQLNHDYSIFLAHVGALHSQILQGWTLKKSKSPEGKTIIVQFINPRVLSVRWADDRRWVEVRGTNYWQWKADDPLHQLIDRITGNLSDLMNGTPVAISPNYSEYPELSKLLQESPPPSTRGEEM